MKLIILAGSLAAAALALPAEAAPSVGFCNICTAQPVEACAAAIATMTRPKDQCPAFAIYDAGGETGQNGNPLNGMSLKDLSLGHPDKRQLENYRRFIERRRKWADRDYWKVVELYNHSKATDAELTAARAIRDEAVVNYLHAVRAYLNFIGKKSN